MLRARARAYQAEDAKEAPETDFRRFSSRRSFSQQPPSSSSQEPSVTVTEPAERFYLAAVRVIIVEASESQFSRVWHSIAVRIFKYVGFLQFREKSPVAEVKALRKAR